MLNGDPTAELCKFALEANGIALSAYLPMNAVPWYDAPASRGAAILKEGARINRTLLIEHGVKLVLLMGRQAQRSERYLDLPSDVVVRRLPHPGRLGLINFRVGGLRVGAERAREILIAGFRLPED